MAGCASVRSERSGGELRHHRAFVFAHQVQRELALLHPVKIHQESDPEFVDFNVPRRPSLMVLFIPHEFFSRMRLRWIGRDIPRSEARWIGDMLGQLSTDQIRDAFRSGGYYGEELDGFTADFEQRIAELKQL